MRSYLAKILRLVDTCGAFAVLAHMGYPMREWPTNASAHDRLEGYEAEYRAVLRALERSGRILEVNARWPWLATRSSDGGTSKAALRCA
jgi:histidinol phosphatase-like PHP family hydrolase